MELIKNSILSFETFLAKYPNDRYNDSRRRQMEMLQEKLAAMTTA